MSNAIPPSERPDGVQHLDTMAGRASDGSVLIATRLTQQLVLQRLSPDSDEDQRFILRDVHEAQWLFMSLKVLLRRD